MNVSIFSGSELRVCRVCLATDVKLYNLHENNLIQRYFEFSGTPIIATDGLPQHICSYCYALLIKSSEFRNKCKNTYTLLLKHLIQIPAFTTSYIETLDKTNLKTVLTATEIQIISIPENNNIAETIPIKKELQKDIEIKDPIGIYSSDDNNISIHNYEYLNLENENIKFEDEVLIVKKEFINKTMKKKRQPKGKKTTYEFENRIKEFENKYLNNTMEEDKRDYYEYILKKYIKNKKVTKSEHNLKTSCTNMTDDAPQFLCKNEDIINTEKDTTTKNIYEKRLYEYIAEKYIKNNNTSMNQPKITDVTRMRKKKPKTRNITKIENDLATFSKEFNVDITTLNKEQQIQDVLSRKETDAYKKAKFKCNDCFRGYSTEEAFQNHKAIHDPSSGPYECEICHIRFASAESRRKHAQSRHKHKYTCKLCGRVTRNRTFAREHYKCHAGYSYVCEHCGKTFSKYASRISHIRIYHASFFCDVCLESFVGQTGLTAHKTKAHRQLFKCMSCGVQFHNSDALQRHLVAEDGEPCGSHVRPCTQCGSNFTNEELLTQHKTEYHNKRNPRPRTQSKCTIKLPSNPKPTVRWRARRSRKPPDQTPADNRTGGETPQKFMCEMCGADGFNSEAVLRYHQRIHTGERPHACPRCPKRFRIKELLQAHIRTHTGARPYQCARCPKAFKTSSQLHTHQTVHTKVRRHRCHICLKTFLTSTCVNAHIRCVHMNIPRRHSTDIEDIDE